MFLAAHGDYFVPETHGILTPRWTILDLAEFTAPQVSRYRKIIGAMDQELCRLAKVCHPKRSDPAMSWQALSQLNILLISLSHSTRLASRTPLAQCNSAAVQSAIGFSQNSTISQKTSPIAVDGVIGQPTERSCKTRGDLHMLEVVDIMTANTLNCRNERSETPSTNAPNESSMHAAKQHPTIVSKAIGNHSPEPVQVRPFTNLDFE